jgi:hypothetical protein
MSKKLILVAAIAALLMFAPTLSRAGGPLDSVITIGASVDQFAEWDVPAGYTITVPAITDMVTPRTAAVNMTLYTNANVTLLAVAGTNNGVLKSTSTGYTLLTSYKLTGSGALTYTAGGGLNGDAAFRLADNTHFFDTSTYLVTHTNGTGAYLLTLTAQATPQTGQAPDAANDYTATLKLTATW